MRRAEQGRIYRGRPAVPEILEELIFFFKIYPNTTIIIQSFNSIE